MNSLKSMLETLHGIFKRGDLLTGIITPIAQEIDDTALQVNNATSMLFLQTVTGSWADYYAKFFGAVRRTLESDYSLAQRAINAVSVRRNNPIALVNNVKDLTGEEIEIFEPWQSLFYLDDSLLDDKIMYDGDYWSPCVFSPVKRGNSDFSQDEWGVVLNELEQSRPTGVIVQYPEWRPDVQLIDISPTALLLSNSQHFMFRTGIDYADYLDYTNLDEHIGKLNYGVKTTSYIGLLWLERHPLPWTGSWDERAWDDATYSQITLTGGAKSIHLDYTWEGDWDSRSWNGLDVVTGAGVSVTPIKITTI